MKTQTNRQVQGFTLVELLIVLAIIGVLAALSTPFVRNIILEGRVEPTAKDIINMTNVMRAQASAAGSATPYTDLGATANATAVFANAGVGRAGNLTITSAGTASTVVHNLGATNSQVTVLQASNPTAGDSFTVTLPTVSRVACPSLATALSRVADAISINGTSVKAIGGAYNGASGANLCTDGDTNTYVFTFR